MRERRLFKGAGRFAAFSPEGSRIVTASADGTARVWDAATGKVIAIFSGHQSSVFFATFSPDGSRIVTTSSDYTARVWDASTGELIALLRGHELSVTSSAFSPDGARIVTVSYDKTARVWDASTGKPIVVLRGHKKSVEFLPPSALTGRASSLRLGTGARASGMPRPGNRSPSSEATRIR